MSADDRSIAAVVADVNNYVWIWDQVTKSGRTFATSAIQPKWDPMGKGLAFLSVVSSESSARLVVQDVRGGVSRQLLSPGGAPTGWVGDVISVDDSGGKGIGVVSIRTPNAPTWIRPGSWGADLSRDGRYISYATDESGRFEVWVEQLEGGSRRQVSTDGGVETVWCSKCDEMFYRNGNRILVSHITTIPALDVGTPRVAFIADDFVDTPGKSFDVSSDGSRMYYVRRTSPPIRNRFHVVQNWFVELKQRSRPK